VNLGTNDWRAAFQSKNISHKNVFFTVYFDNICDLYYWVLVWCWKFTRLGWTLDVKTQNSKRCNFTEL